MAISVALRGILSVKPDFGQVYLENSPFPPHLIA
jgi:hypothetical protein